MIIEFGSPCCRLIASTVTFDEILTIIQGIGVSHYVDELDPIKWSNNRRLLVDLKRLKNADERQAHETFGTAIEQIVAKKGHGANLSICDLLLVIEDESDVD